SFRRVSRSAQETSAASFQLDGLQHPVEARKPPAAITVTSSPGSTSNPTACQPSFGLRATRRAVRAYGETAGSARSGRPLPIGVYSLFEPERGFSHVSVANGEFARMIPGMEGATVEVSVWLPDSLQRAARAEHE